jgi:hypothetical protein
MQKKCEKKSVILDSEFWLLTPAEIEEARKLRIAGKA